MSAGSNTKLELANEAAVRCAGAARRRRSPGRDARRHRRALDRAARPGARQAQIANDIRAVGLGGGGIYVDITLEAGYAALAKEHVQLKHLLLFADGYDAEERSNAFALVSAGKARGITTSVVALGKGSDVPELEHMSKLGDGRFYLIEDASRLPAVFAQETILAARSSINELSFRPQLAAAGPATRGIDFASAPPLKGYVVTIPKGRAQVHLDRARGRSDPRDLVGGHRSRGGVHQRLQGSLGRGLDELGRRRAAVRAARARSGAARRQSARARRGRHPGRRAARARERDRRARARRELSAPRSARRGPGRLLATRAARSRGRGRLRRQPAALAPGRVRRHGRRRAIERGARHDRRRAHRGRRAAADRHRSRLAPADHARSPAARCATPWPASSRIARRCASRTKI